MILRNPFTGSSPIGSRETMAKVTRRPAHFFRFSLRLLFGLQVFSPSHRRLF